MYISGILHYTIGILYIWISILQICKDIWYMTDMYISSMYLYIYGIISIYIYIIHSKSSMESIIDISRCNIHGLDI